MDLKYEDPPKTFHLTLEIFLMLFYNIVKAV